MPPGKRLPLVAVAVPQPARWAAAGARPQRLLPGAPSAGAATRRPLPPDVRAGYLRALRFLGATAIAVLRFVQDIPLAPGDPGYDLVTASAGGAGPLPRRCRC